MYIWYVTWQGISRVRRTPWRRQGFRVGCVRPISLPCRRKRTSLQPTETCPTRRPPAREKYFPAFNLASLYLCFLIFNILSSATKERKRLRELYKTRDPEKQIENHFVCLPAWEFLGFLYTPFTGMPTWRHALCIGWNTETVRPYSCRLPIEKNILILTF